VSGRTPGKFGRIAGATVPGAYRPKGGAWEDAGVLVPVGESSRTGVAVVTPHRLNVRTRLRADDGKTYEVEAILGRGGYGTTYTGHRVSVDGRRLAKVCIKVCRDRNDWHGEAFFGQMLKGNSRVVQLRDAFVAATGQGSKQRRRHVLIFEYMEDGTVWDRLDRGDRAWSEAKVRREIKALLNVLACLHNAGVTHRDLKPDNVYLRDGGLVLGDFGITKMTMDPSHSFVSVFAPDFAPSNVLQDLRWGQADDVFQVGLLAATLLSGEIWWNDSVSVKSIAALPASDAFKCWIWHATGARSKRYWDATDAVHALDSLKRISLSPGRAPRSLADQSIVFTGRMNGLSRPEAVSLARNAGAQVQAGVSDATSLVIAGRTKAGSIGAGEGLKLFAVRERRRLGQNIRIIDQHQFERLLQR
jgi:serine/threonine protein kinase